MTKKKVQNINGPMSKEQETKLAGLLAGTIPRSSLQFGRAEVIINNPTALLERVAKDWEIELQTDVPGLSLSPTIYPAIGERFSLTFDPEIIGSGPIEMVEITADLVNWKKWEFNGEAITNRRISRFKLVSVGYCRDIAEMRAKLGLAIPSGQWLPSFKAAYSSHDGKGRVGIADPNWVNPGGHAVYPYLEAGGMFFRRADQTCGHDWRWIVSVAEE